jgi:hypothetical protein
MSLEEIMNESRFFIADMYEGEPDFCRVRQADVFW